MNEKSGAEMVVTGLEVQVRVLVLDILVQQLEMIEVDDPD